MEIAQGLVVLFCSAALGLHLTGILLVLFRTRTPGRSVAAPPDAGVTLLRPVCGLENHIEETLASTFTLAHPHYEALFCVASAADPIIPLVERLMAVNPSVPARLLVGDDRICGNPKLNNLVKGWKSASHDWIIMADSNVLLPVDYIEQLFSRWTAGTGLVSSPAVGIRPAGFWSELECAFLNTYQARWQLAADQLGLGFAQGKNMLWQRDVLDAAGGIGALAAELAEDVAATKIVHDAGLKVRLVQSPFPQPLGPRSLSEVWRRQLRWARLRRVGLKAYFVPELLTGGFFPLSAAGLAAAAGELSFALTAALAVLWFGAEAVLARSAGWPSSLRSVLAGIVRDVLIPVLWVAAWTGTSFVWRGNRMVLNPEGVSDLDRPARSTPR
jgi:ceramide glucosyltransferase